MRKILILALSLLLVLSVSVGLTACTPDSGETKSYTLDTSGFNSTAVFGEELSLNGLKLICGSETVSVSKDMISGIDTSTVGQSTLTVSYNGQSFNVDYTVKYRVTFVIDGKESVQLVSDVSEVIVPEPPVIVGKQFDRWSLSLPSVLSSNLRIDAIYKTISNERENAYTWSGEGIINLAGYREDGSTVSYTVTDEEGNALDGALVSLNGDKLEYTIGDFDVLVISISGEGVIPKSWRVSKTDEPTLSIASGASAVGIALGSNRYSEKINVPSTPVSFKYELTLANANVNAAESNGYVFIDVLKAGVTELTVKAINSTNEAEYITLTQYVVVTPTTLAVPNSFVDTNAIEQIWTIGRYGSDRLPALTVGGINADKIGEGFYSNLSWVSENENVTVSEDGRITLKDVSADPEIVEIRAVFSYEGVEFKSAPLKVRCVYDGINVFGYSELYAETLKAEPRPIVLQTDIKDDFSSTNFTWMRSTYDLTYYYNIGKSEDDMRVKVLLTFKNDLYGNGYEINAHNATLGTLDSTGNPTEATLFRGPLNFVAMTDSGGAISVKAQDNIVFALYENVKVNNVVLKSCDLTAYDGKVDLRDLEFAGTTVEVLGDNVAIEYSRLMNGRTVLRIFGDVEDSEKEINVTVKNTLIKGSREFNTRIGSNRFEYTENVASPYLPGDESGSAYNSKSSYSSMSDSAKAEYDEKYINTFVTFENVVFEDSGIFDIAIDSHFAGEALRDGTGYLSGVLNGWKNLAKTSYGAKVTLKDDVRLYSWKALDDIDSGTIIENTFASSGSGDNIFANLKFDIKDIIKNAALSGGNYSNILYSYEGKDYVHAGIVLFGGGKNYSVVENLVTEFNHTLSTYVVALRELQGQGYLEAASGGEPFRFIAYNKDSTFTYFNQISMTNKYDCLYK